ncbi:MAG: ABC transporter ATP-binding protein [Actinomycetota bacterium]
MTVLQSGAPVADATVVTDPVVRFVDTERRFGEVTALASLRLDIPSGAITVILGPNGAGKTTAMRLITGALSPSSGAVEVFGLRPDGPDGGTIRRRCGVVTAKPSLYDRLNGWDNLRYAAELFGFDRSPDTDARIADAAARFGIVDALEQQVGGYSTGMKTRLALARSVLHDPELLLLDEPTSGLDPESAAAVLDLIRHMTSAGQTVVLCTHLLAEAEGLADQMVVMEGGALMTAGTPGALAARHWPLPLVYLGSDRPDDLDRLALWAEVEGYERDGARAAVTLASPEVDLALLVARLCAEGVRLTSVEPYRPSLEDIYFAERAADRPVPPPPDGRALAPVGAS